MMAAASARMLAIKAWKRSAKSIMSADVIASPRGLLAGPQTHEHKPSQAVDPALVDRAGLVHRKVRPAVIERGDPQAVSSQTTEDPQGRSTLVSSKLAQ